MNFAQIVKKDLLSLPIVTHRDLKAYLLMFVLFLIHYTSGYPGGMSSDSFSQYIQSLNLTFDDHHPPLMSMIWSGFNLFSKGPQLMLLFNLVLLWSSVIVFYSTFKDTHPRIALAFIFIPFFPAILSVSTVMWKDVFFAHPLLLAASIATYFTVKGEKPSIWIIISGLLLVFYATGIKFQVKFIVPVIILWLISISIKRSYVAIISTTILLSFMIIWGNIYLKNSFSTETHSEQMRQIFDIAGISVNANQNLFPTSVTTNPAFSWEKIKKYYTPILVDPLLYFPETRIYVPTRDATELRLLNDAFYQVVRDHPFSYLKHRSLNFAYNLAGTKFKRYGHVDEEYGAPLGIFNQNSFIKTIVVNYIKYTPVFLSGSYLAFIILLAQFIYTIRLYKNKAIKDKKELLTLLFMGSIALTYAIVLFFTSMASDFRYFYIIRLFTYFMLPITFLVAMKYKAVKEVRCD